ncbi:hypothetical protein J40TS1_52030 [Paenibacillus montaniterrae]|uniref:DUF4097 domain-containing protein n=1 Tax=Paenibacillus montaniterrae TaxID=429341 RepID=A0A919YW09_9BACL|nr:DUF4097 family beta strand repeat-containing protein [Paenibacillus montaniterrae]GIP19561.1 hypothetical protein J40TS1_52030 [Paenibacillus montaniterrae]
MKKQVLIGGAIIICGLFIVFSNLFDFRIFNRIERGEQASQSYNAAQLEKLTIEASSTNVMLLPTDRDEIELKLYDAANKSYDIASHVRGELKNNHLSLEVTSPKKWFAWFSFLSTTLEITVPTHMMDEIVVENKSGNIQGSGFHASTIVLEANSGNIKLSDTDTADLYLSTLSGSISAEQLIADTIDIESNSGSVKLTSFTANDVTVEANSGNITIEGDTASVDAQASSGNINLELVQLTGDSSLETSSGNIKLSLEQPDSLYVTHEKNSGTTSITKSGFELLKEERRKIEGVFGNGEIELDVKTSSGNFSLK